MRWRIISALLVLTPCGVFGQTATAFEVASVKPSPPWQPGMTAGMTFDGSRFISSLMLMRTLIVSAYDVPPWRISGGPAWLDSDGYEIDASVPREARNAPKEQVEIMLRTLLADRFKLAIHRETRDYPVYALVVAKGGPKLLKAADGGFSVRKGVGHLEIHHVSMATFVGNLLSSVDRPVVNMTELQGLFDIVLDWTPDTGARASDAGPSIFTAIQEQLGLKLEPRKSPFELIVIDHIERPSEN